MSKLIRTPRLPSTAGYRAVVLLLLTSCAAMAQDSDRDALIGRWDVTVQGEDGPYPSWFEVRKSGYSTLVGSFVGRFGSARPISEVSFDGKAMRFQVPPQWEQRDIPVVFEGEMADGKLSGVTLDDEGKELRWTATRAPKLERDSAVEWGKPIELFDGNSLRGWRSRHAGQAHGWKVQDGVLVNAQPGMDLVTQETFEDFKLHVEFRYPEGSNSGLYLRGRYEVQIEDNYGGEPDSHRIGGVYGFLTPSLNAAKPAGEWQEVDITLTGRQITVVLNGERIIDRQTIPGPTGGALDSAEGEPGPLMIQGDHGPVEFRKITLTPAVE